MDIPLLLFLLLLLLLSTTWCSVGSAPTREPLTRGFSATPDPSVSSFQPLLTDLSGNYSLGFLRLNRTRLALAVLHVPSSEPIWLPAMTRLPRWAAPTKLSFNGSLVISDTHTRVFWSTNTAGDAVLLSNTSNLQILKSDGPHSIVWQSFEFPSDTLMENQNFTSTVSLKSSNELYSMRLGPDFLGLYSRYQIYLKHKALEVKAEIIEGIPIYVVLNPDGFLGMYQNGSAPVDVQSFSSFQQPGSGSRRVRLEPDGNLVGYYWTGSSWILDYQAISDPCELPSSCGSYGLCQSGKACSCLDNRSSGGCDPPENKAGDFCNIHESKYWVLRRKGVDLPHKELMGYEKMASLEQCEGACELNCTCWGVVYSNASGFCYRLDYPIQTLVGVGDETKVGYFKVRAGARKQVGLGVGIGLLCGAILVFCGLLGFGLYRYCGRKRGVSGYVDEDGGGAHVGPYKDLQSASFRSIEMT